MLRSAFTLLALAATLFAEPPAEETPKHAPNATLDPSELAEFSSQPPRIQTLLAQALTLTTKNLTYTYGSSDPAGGGMDCSGTIYYLLRNAGFKDVPRDSSGQYVWARKAGGFQAVVSKNAKSFEFDELLPGDLLFWSGTYQVSREIPITHVMLYLGTEKKRKQRVMFGASDGRSYNGAQRWGVSVFDFVMPKANPSDPAKARVDFVGYARIPGLRDSTLPLASTSLKEDDSESPSEEIKAADSNVSNSGKDDYKLKPTESKAASSMHKKSGEAPSDTPSKRTSSASSPSKSPAADAGSETRPSMHKKSDKDASGTPTKRTSTTTSSSKSPADSDPETPPSMHKKSSTASEPSSSKTSKGGFIPRKANADSDDDDAASAKSKTSAKSKSTPSPRKKKKASE